MARVRYRAVSLMTTAGRNHDMLHRVWQIDGRQEKAVLELLGPPQVESIVSGDTASAIHTEGQKHGMAHLELEEDPHELEIDAALAMPVRTLACKVTEDGSVMVGIVYGVIPKPEDGSTEVDVPMVRDGHVIIKRHEFDAWLGNMKQWWEQEKSHG